MKTELADLLKKAIDVELTARIHTMLPGRIISYDPSNQQASVQPLIKKTYLNGKIDSMPIITNVPVVFPRSGGSSLTLPVDEGDTAILFFAERSLERWLSSGDEVEAGLSRKFSIKDCVAMVGLLPLTGSSLSTGKDVVLRYNDAQFTINNDNKLAIGSGENELISMTVDLLDIVKTITTDPPTIALLDLLKLRFEAIKGELV